MGNDIFNYINNLITKNKILDDEELKDFNNIIINRLISYTQYKKLALIYNIICFSLDKRNFYLTIFKTLPNNAKLLDKKIKLDEDKYPDFFIDEIKKLYKVNRKTALEYAKIICSNDEIKKQFISLFDWKIEKLKKLGVTFAVNSLKGKTKSERWW